MTPTSCTSQKGIDLIKEFEGLRLETYLCPAGIPTIGYGSTGPHVKMGMRITQQQAEELLKKDLQRFERGVNAEIKVPITKVMNKAPCFSYGDVVKSVAISIALS